MYVICFYAPKDYAETVKTAMFNAGAGEIGKYSHCSFQTEGSGQFLPLENANPAIGSVGTVQTVKELKIEIVCKESVVRKVIRAMKQAHPYEEVAFHILQPIDI